jgi:hypothetical protein
MVGMLDLNADCLCVTAAFSPNFINWQQAIKVKLLSQLIKAESTHVAY